MHNCRNDEFENDYEEYMCNFDDSDLSGNAVDDHLVIGDYVK